MKTTLLSRVWFPVLGLFAHHIFHGLLAAMLLAAPGVAQDPFSISTYAVTTDVEEAFLPSVRGWDLPVMSADGRTVYRGSGSLGSFGNHRSAFFVDGTMVLVAEGYPNGVFDGFDHSPFINTNGQIAFAANMRTGPSEAPVYKRAYFAGAPGAPTLVAIDGGPAPDTGGGAFWFEFQWDEIDSYNALGQVTFRGYWTGGIGGDNDKRGLWAGTPGNLRLVARVQGDAPDLPSGTKFLGVSKGAVLNDAGQIAFTASVEDPGATEGYSVVYLGPVDAPKVAVLGGTAVRGGAPAPGAGPGVKFGMVEDVSLSSSGQIAIRSSLVLPPLEAAFHSTYGLQRALFAGPPEALELVARERFPAPGVTDGAIFTYLEKPVINGAGEVAFVGMLTGFTDYGVWAGRPGQLRLIARSGTPAPGTDAEFRQFDSLILSESGQVVFVAQLMGGNVDVWANNDRALYATDKTGVLRLVARTGSSLNGSPALTDIVTTPGNGTSESQAATGDGTRCSVDAQGRILFKAYWPYVDQGTGQERMFLATPAESEPVIPVEGQPRSLAAAVGGRAEFRVNALGSRPATFQWRHNGQDLDGQTGDTLVLDGLSAEDAGAYTVGITNAEGDLESQAAQLTFPPVITQQPRSRSVEIGKSGALQAQAASPTAVSWQWQFKGPADADFADLGGATSAAYPITSAQPSHAGRYRVRATNSQGSVLSNEALLTISPAGQPAIERVVMTGDPVPDLAGATFGNIDEASLNNVGDVAFHFYSLRDSEGQERTGAGLFVGREADFEYYPGSLIGGGDNLSDSGMVVAQSNLIDGFYSGLLHGGPSGLQTLTRRFQQAPGTDLAFESYNTPAINASGTAAFSYMLTGGFGIFTGTPGALQLRALTDEPAPGLGGDAVFTAFSVDVGLNHSGTVVFWAQVSGSAITEDNDEGIWTAGAGGVQRVVAEGQQAPGLAAGVRIGSIPKGCAAINDAGEIAFVAALAGTGVTGSNDEAIFAGPPGALKLVVRKGQSASGLTFNQLTDFTNRAPILGGGGHVIFTATAGAKESLWLWTPGAGSGTLRLLAREGVAAPGRSAGVVFGPYGDFNTGFGASVNSAGQVLFFGSFTRPGTEEGGTGLWLTNAAGDIKHVGGRGDAFDVGGGVTKQIDFISGFYYTGGQDGSKRNLNEDGEALFLVNFTDGSRGVFIASFPKPSLAAPSGFAIVSGAPGADWTFSATLASNEPGLFLRVQSTLTPGDEESWTDLPGGGQMTRSGNTWTLQTAAIPLGTRFFRVIAAAEGFTDGIAQHGSSYEVDSPAGRILYTRGSALSRELVIMKVDGSGKTVLAGGGPFNVQQCALSADGQHVAFTTLNGRLYVMKAEPMNGDTNPPVNILETAEEVEPLFGSGIAWSPFGPHLAFAGTDSRIYVIEVLDDNGDITPYNDTSVPLVDVGGTLSGAPNPAWSPDGRYLALLGGNHIQVLEVADVSGNITEDGASNFPVALTLQSDFSSVKTHAAWSPNSQTIAFVERTISGDQAKVSLLTACDPSGTLTPESGANPRSALHVMTATPLAKTVSWSPDGALLALQVESGGQSHIELIKPEPVGPGNPRLILTTQGVDGDAFQPSFKQPVSGMALPNLVAFQSPSYAGNEGEDPIVVRVVRTGSAAAGLEVGFAVTGGTAEEGADFTLSESPLLFAPGQTEAQILVTPLADGLDDEGDETIELDLVATSAGEIGEPAKTVITVSDAGSDLQLFMPAAAEIAVAVNGKKLKKGNAKSGDRFEFTVRQDLGALLDGLEVQIQVTTTPKDTGSWVNVTALKMKRPTKTSMTWKGAVSASQLPHGTVHFRTRSYATGHRSNAGPVAGPFKITPAPVLVLVTSVASDSDAAGLTVKPGEFIRYKIDCHNIGMAVAKKVVLNSCIPPMTRFDAASHDSGSFPGYFKRVTGTKGLLKGALTDVQWHVGNINPGGVASEFVDVQVNQEVEFTRLIQNDRLTYKMTGLKETFMPILRTTVQSPLVITVAKDKNVVVAGDLITYTLTIKNEASYDVTGGKVNNEIPNGTRLYSANQGDGAGNYLGTALAHSLLDETPQGMSRPGYTAYNRMLVWNVGTVPAGGQRQLRFTVRVAYDLFEKIARNGESYNTEIQNLNFDFTGTPPSGGIIAARGGVIPGNQIARSLVSEEEPPQRPELAMEKKAFSDSVALSNDKPVAGVFEDGARVIQYRLNTWNYGNITAEDTLVFDALPLNTDFHMDIVVWGSLQGSQKADVLDTDEPHGFTVNEKILFTSLDGGKGLKTGTVYHVKEVLSPTSFKVSATSGGAVVSFTTDLVLGGVRRAAYDWPRFMSRFSLDGVPFTFPDGFTFFDENGNELSPGGEPYVDTNGNGKVDKGEFIDQNGNSKYDGPDKVRSFEYRLGHLPPMARPTERTLAYQVKVRPTVARGTLVTAFSSALHLKSQGLELISPDFIYPLFGAPEKVHAKIIQRVNWTVSEPVALGVHYIADKPETHSIPYRITFKNNGDLFAVDAKLRIPVPERFQISGGSGQLVKFDAKLDTKLPQSPGTWVIHIGEVAPGAEVTRDITCTFLPPIPKGWLDDKGFLRTSNIPIFPQVVSTKASNLSAQPPPPGGFSLLSVNGLRQEVAFAAKGGNATFTSLYKSNTAPRCFIGRIAPAAIQAGTALEIFIFYGNHGGVSTQDGQIAMQIPYGTHYLDAEPINLNPDEGGTNYTVPFTRGFITVEPLTAKGRRPADGNIGTVRFNFKSGGAMLPASIGVVRVRVFVNYDFPGSWLTDNSLEITYRGVAGRSPSPLSVQVLRNTNGATDWWQGTLNFFDKIGSEVNSALRNLFGGDNGGEFRYGSQIVTLGGADFVHLPQGAVIIPLGRNRSAIIAEYDHMVGQMPPSSFMLVGETGSRGLALAAGLTNAQQMFVPGAINQNRMVQSILAELTSPSSIVAAGGGNIVAAGGGNIVAAGGGNIVAGGGGNVVANDGAGLLPGSITFSIPGVNPGIVAAGGGNIVAAGGGNIVAAGGGNIVAAGGGNIVAAGGGNVVAIDGVKMNVNKLAEIITKLAIFDGAGLLDSKNLKLIGLDGASAIANDGAGLIGSDGASLVGQDGAGFSPQ